MSSQSTRRWLIGSGVLLLLVVAIRAWLQWVGPLPGDHYAITHFMPWRRQGTLQVEIDTAFDDLGTPPVAFFIVLVAVCALWRRDRRREAMGAVLACVVVVWSGLLKEICGPTPLWADAHYSGSNYPSGHVAFVTAVIGYLGLLGRRHRQPEVVAVAVLLVVAVGPSRVISGAHLVSDGIAGYCLGAAWLILVWLWLNGRSPPAAIGDS